MENYYKWEKVYSLPISALQHYIYCPRQFGLIHIEEMFEENVFTLKGNFAHERVDDESYYYIKKKNVENSLPIWSEKLGLYGIADVVEFIKGIPLPVEFKSGKRKNKLADDIQLMAQGVCLEEMFNLKINKGAVYYHRSRRRREVIFDTNLRNKLYKTVDSVRNLLVKQRVPEPVNDNRCTNCSLITVCLPDVKEQIKKIQDF